MGTRRIFGQFVPPPPLQAIGLVFGVLSSLAFIDDAIGGEAHVAPIAIEWGGYGGLIAGTADYREQIGIGIFSAVLPNSDGVCSGSYRIDNSGSGTWAIACTNGLNASGTLKSAGDRKGASGRGTDIKGRKVRLTVGASVVPSPAAPPTAATPPTTTTPRDDLSVARFDGAWNWKLGSQRSSLCNDFSPRSLFIENGKITGNIVLVGLWGDIFLQGSVNGSGVASFSGSPTHSLLRFSGNFADGTGRGTFTFTSELGQCETTWEAALAG